MPFVYLQKTKTEGRNGICSAESVERPFLCSWALFADSKVSRPNRADPRCKEKILSWQVGQERKIADSEGWRQKMVIVKEMRTS
jgi:hypothetical protein